MDVHGILVLTGPAEEVPVEVSQANPQLAVQDCPKTDTCQTPAIFGEQTGTKVAGFYLSLGCMWQLVTLRATEQSPKV